MAYNAGNLMASLSLNIADFTKSINTALAEAKTAGASFQSSFGGGQNSVNRMNSSLKDTQTNLKDVSRIVGGILISQVFYQAIQAIKEACSNLVQFDNDMEQANISLQYLLGNKDDADAFLQVMQDFAATTPFDTQESVAWAKELMAMGIAATNVHGVMATLADTSAATGATADQMSRIVLAIGEIQSTGSLSARQLRQLALAGIPAYSIIRKQLGLTAKQMENIGKLHISSTRAINALLEGLNAKYKGASKLVADTWAGMWSTIYDDSVIISSKLTAGMFSDMESVVRTVRNGLEAMRQAMKTGGLAGALETIMPKQVVDSLRLVLAGLQRIGAAIVIMAQTVGTAFSDGFGILTTILGQVLPLIGTVAEAAARVVQVMIVGNPIVRGFAAAIAAVLIAKAAASVLLFFWRIVGLGAICTRIAKAVVNLGATIEAVVTFLEANPIVLVITAIAAALLYWAYTAGVLNNALSALEDTISNLLGLDTSKILPTTAATTDTSLVDKYNKALQKLKDSYSDDSTAADKATKAVTKFAASFDELFQVPDKLDSTTSALDGIGDLIGGLPSDAGKTPTPTPSGDGKDGKSTLPIIEKPGSGTKDGDGGTGGLFSELKAAIPEIEEEITKLVDWLKEKAKEGSDALGNALRPAPGWVTAIVTAFSLLPAAVAGSLQKTAKAVGQWVGQVQGLLDPFSALNPVVDAFDMLTDTVDTTITLTQQDVETWISDTESAFNTWASVTESTIATWATATEQTVIAWSGATAQTIFTWIANTQRAFANWSTVVQHTFGSWSANTLSVFSTTLAATLGKIVNWIGSTEQDFHIWATEVESTVIGWAVATNVTIATSLATAASSIGIWIGSTKQSFDTWVSDTETTFATWASHVYTTIDGWVSDTEQDFDSWAAATLLTINTWTASTEQALTDWSISTLAAIESWTTDSNQDFSNWSLDAVATFTAWSASVIRVTQTTLASALTAINNWIAASERVLAQWGLDTVTKLKAGWVITFPAAIAKGNAEALTEIGSWIAQSKKALSKWATDTVSDLKLGWVLTFPDAIRLGGDHALGKVQAWVTDSKKELSTWSTDTLATVVAWGGLLAVDIGKAFAKGVTAMTKGIKSLKTQLGKMGTAFSTFFGWLGSSIGKKLSNIGSAIASWWAGVVKTVSSWSVSSSTSSGKAASSTVAAEKNEYYNQGLWEKGWTEKKGKVYDAKGNLIGDAASVSNTSGGGATVKGGAVGNVNIPAVPSLGGFEPIPAFATGGFTDVEGLIRTSEGNKREAVIPLQNEAYMAPFAQAVASYLLNSTQATTTSNTNNMQPLLVGTLIADDAGLKQLERKMKVIRLQEAVRIGD